MYDNISIFLETREEVSQKYLGNWQEKTKLHSFEPYFVGDLKNLLVCQFKNGISVRGSLSKYYYGDNLRTLTLDHTECAIDKLCLQLDVSFYDAIVYKMEFGTNFILNHPVGNYLILLNEYKKSKKTTFGNESIYFKSSKKDLVFYNKTKEMNKKKIIIPVEYKDLNNRIMRYEIRLNKRINEQFMKTVKLYHLYDEDFFFQVLTIWKDSYFAISKLKVMKNNLTSYVNYKNYMISLALSNIQGKGLEYILKDIDLNRHFFKSTQEASRTKANIRKLVNKNEYSLENDLIKELDEKVLKVLSIYGLGKKVA